MFAFLNTSLGYVLASASGSQAATNITSFITSFVGPILLLAIGIIAIKFLVQRQMTQFFQFLAVAILVAVLFYTPGLIEKIGTWFGGLASGFFGP
jgi:ABC-type multidrug transport system fused ATPase/permease subunit